MAMLEIQNHGPLITSTNFWETEHCRTGKLFLSFNDNGARLLVPPALNHELNDMSRNLQHVVLSIGPWPAMDLERAVEIMFEDGSQTPYCVHLGEPSTDRKLSGDGRDDLIFIAYNRPRRGRPHKVFERPCYLRSVPLLPNMKPWE